MLDGDVFDRATVNKQDLFRLRGAAHPDFPDKPGHRDAVRRGRFDFQQLFEQLRSAEIPDPIGKGFRGRCLEHDVLITDRNETDVRMTNGLQGELMMDMTGFRVLAPQKFSARRQVIEKGSHLDLGARGFTGSTDECLSCPR